MYLCNYFWISDYGKKRLAVTDTYWYVCQESDGPLEQRYYEIYALPNGSVPLKKSVIKLIYDVYNMTQVKDGDLEDQHVAEELSYTWFPKRAGKDVYERYDNEFLAQFAYEGMNCR